MRHLEHKHVEAKYLKKKTLIEAQQNEKKKKKNKNVYDGFIFKNADLKKKTMQLFGFNVVFKVVYSLNVK